MKVFYLVLALSFVFVFETSQAESFGSNPRRYVNITNYLGPGIELTVHCKSKDDDLGQKGVAFQHSYQWHFKSNFAGTTRFYCYMWWQNVYGSFDVYRASRDDERCATCLWKITTFGAFSHNEETSGWDLIYVWQSSEK